MTKLNAVYVPDEMWSDFGRGVIDHFAYGTPTSVAVYADGHRVEFDSTVTDDMIAAERLASIERMRADPRCLLVVEFRSETTVRNHHGVIVGWVE